MRRRKPYALGLPQGRHTQHDAHKYREKTNTTQRHPGNDPRRRSVDVAKHLAAQGSLCRAPLFLHRRRHCGTACNRVHQRLVLDIAALSLVCRSVPAHGLSRSPKTASTLSP
jgi:hypothetical protein